MSGRLRLDTELRDSLAYAVSADVVPRGDAAGMRAGTLYGLVFDAAPARG
ncbi:hypothetical protein [Nocardia thraciensis]